MMRLVPYRLGGRSQSRSGSSAKAAGRSPARQPDTRIFLRRRVNRGAFEGRELLEPGVLLHLDEKW
jgi:hypothetical protein